MIFKYNLDISKETLKKNLDRMVGQIYRLLPTREEELDWKKPLKTIIEELAGMDRLFIDQQDIYFKLLCKLEGLFTLEDDDEDTFLQYRGIIFECISLVKKIEEYVCD